MDGFGMNPWKLASQWHQIKPNTSTARMISVSRSLTSNFPAIIYQWLINDVPNQLKTRLQSAWGSLSPKATTVKTNQTYAKVATKRDRDKPDGAAIRLFFSGDVIFFGLLGSANYRITHVDMADEQRQFLVKACPVGRDKSKTPLPLGVWRHSEGYRLTQTDYRHGRHQSNHRY